MRALGPFQPSGSNKTFAYTIWTVPAEVNKLLNTNLLVQHGRVTRLFDVGSQYHRVALYPV
jgi:hypothetical protein